MFILELLKEFGIREYNLHHIDDAGRNGAIPLKIREKVYDISYVSYDGEVFLIEVMRLGKNASVRHHEKQEQEAK